ncbi:MAG: TrkA family potassium uptake protein [Deltaproteobacteria bacterium]|nr:MAG: TrkA family potassium uptake protein [Deltaproteobacteria bacterium]
MKKIAVIGIGNFGYYLATRLYSKGYDVMVVDKNPDRIQKIKDSVSQALVADSTDRKTMEATGIGEMDLVVICIGSDLSASILTTLEMKELGIERVIAKALSEPHGRILSKLGVQEVFFPEKDLAVSMAERLHNPNMLDYLPFLEDYGIVQLAPPPKFIGKSLRELNMINSYGVQVVAVKEMVPDRLNMIPTGNFVLKDSDLMILIGPNKGIEKIKQE